MSILIQALERKHYARGAAANHERDLPYLATVAASNLDRSLSIVSLSHFAGTTRTELTRLPLIAT